MAIAFYAPTNWTGTTSPRTVVITSFAAGDEIIVGGAIEGGGAGISLATPTATGLTFSLVTSNTGGGECASYLWRAVAGASGSSVTVSSVKVGTGQAGICAWVRPGTAASRVTLTGNLTEAGYSQAVTAGDDVIVLHGDFLASAATKTISTGSGTPTERVDVQANSSTYSIWAGDWQNCSAGTFTFGITSYTGTQVAKVGIVLKPPATTNAAAGLASATGTAQAPKPLVGANAVQATAVDTDNNDASPSPMFGAAGAYLTGATTSTANFPVPPGTAAGQLVVVSMYLESLTTISTIPSGFTLEYRASTGPSSGSPDHDLLVFWKWCTGTDAGTYDFVLAGNFWREGVAVRYSNGVGSGSPFDNYTSAVTSSSTGGVTPSVGLTTNSTNDLLVFIGTNFNQGAWTPPSGWYERVDAGTNLTVDDLYQLGVGATGSITATCSGGATTSIGFLASLKGPNSATAGTSVAAGLASATGSAQGATGSVKPAPSAAQAAGTGQSATAKGTTAAGLASATGAANNATAALAVSGPAGVAQATGTGQGATTKGTTSAGLASATGAAQNATVATAVSAPAGVAQGTGTGQDAAPYVRPAGGLASATGTASNATAATGALAQAGVASATGTGVAPSILATSNATPGVASATGSAAGAATTSSGNATAGVAAASGAAQTPRAGVGGGAGSAAGAGTTPNASTTSSGNATPGVAQATGSAQAPNTGIGSGAGSSAGVGTAPSPSATASGNATPGVAQASGTAYNASAGSNTSASAGVASATGTAQNEAGRYIVAQAATASGSAADASVSIKAVASPATAGATATGPVAAVGTLPGPAAATGTGQGATTSSSNGAQAGVASATGAASSPGVSARVNPTQGAGSGTAGNATAATGTLAQAGVAGGSGTAYGVSTVSYRLAPAEAAGATGLAYNAIVFVVAPGQAHAGVASARGAAYGAVRRPSFVGGLSVLLQIQTLTVISPAPGGPDSFGNQTWDYGVGAVRRDIIGWIQQDQRSEGFIAGRDPLEEHWLLMTNDTAITGRDRVYWGAGPTGPLTFEVEGPPEPAYRPGSGFHHTEATMRILTG